jgi:hypothetical protein
LIPREVGSRSTAAVRSEGGKVDGGRKRTTMMHSEGGGVEVDGLRKRTAMARSEAGVEVVACSKAGDEAAACSGDEIEDSRW